MKAVLALILIYIGTFLVAIQGGSLAEVQAAPQASSPAQSGELAAGAIDPAKEADIRALLELVGARDQVQDSMTHAAEQYRERLLETVPNNQQGEAFINVVISSYEKKFDVDTVTDQLISVYDKHYTDEEIKGLLQFYGSPLGQKVAAESPKIGREIQESIRLSSGKAAKEALQEAKQENPGVGQNARLATPGKRFQGRLPRQTYGAQQSAQQQDPQ
ncbi:MAG TPA: DUF2059 domain-containing protein [Candidatus Baltobacteraceae bacterium]|nr:DUF2059 domain-containing protein [Candidatus Baltobacteraceae bacterium]